MDLEGLNALKRLSFKCILNIEYNNIGTYKKDIYFTNNSIAIDFLIQGLKGKEGFKLNIPEETQNTVVGFDCKEKRFVKLHRDLIKTVCLPYLEEANPAALLRDNISKEDQEKVLNLQASILESTVTKIESSKVAIDCPSLKFTVNVERALSIVNILKNQLFSKNPRIVGRVKKDWYNKILEHRDNIISYLEKEKDPNSKNEDIDVIINNLKNYDFKTSLFNFQKPVDILSYWPEILNPKPDYVIGFDYVKFADSSQSLVVDHILNSITNEMIFNKYRVFGFDNGQFVQYERAVSIVKNTEGIHLFMFPLDRGSVASGDYGISNVYHVLSLHFTNINGKYVFTENLLGTRKYDWTLLELENNNFEINSNEDQLSIRFMKGDILAHPKEVLKEVIVFEKS